MAESLIKGNVPDWFQVEGDLDESTTPIIVREEENGTWSVVRAHLGKDLEVDAGYPTKEAAYHAALLGDEGSGIVIESRRRSLVKHADIRPGMVVEYAEEPVTVIAVDGDTVEVITQEGKRFFVDRSQIDAKELPASETTETSCGLEEVKETSCGPKESEEEKSEEEMKEGPPVTIVTMPSYPGERLYPTGIKVILTALRIPYKEAAGTIWVKVADKLEYNPQNSTYRVFDSEGNPVSNVMNRDEAEKWLLENYPIGRETVSSLLHKAAYPPGTTVELPAKQETSISPSTKVMPAENVELYPEQVASVSPAVSAILKQRKASINIVRLAEVLKQSQDELVQDQALDEMAAKSPPVCKKCGKPHWPFQKCPTEEPTTEKSAAVYIGKGSFVYVPAYDEEAEVVGKEGNMLHIKRPGGTYDYVRMQDVKSIDSQEPVKWAGGVLSASQVAAYSTAVAEKMQELGIKTITAEELSDILEAEELEEEEAEDTNETDEETEDTNETDEEELKQIIEDMVEDIQAELAEKEAVKIGQTEEAPIDEVGQFGTNEEELQSYVDEVGRKVVFKGDHWEYEDTGEEAPAPPSSPQSPLFGTAGKVTMKFDWAEFFNDVLPQLSNKEFQTVYEHTLNSPPEVTASQEEHDLYKEEILKFTKEASRRGLPDPTELAFGIQDIVRSKVSPIVEGVVTEYKKEGRKVKYLVASGRNELWFEEKELSPVLAAQGPPPPGARGVDVCVCPVCGKEYPHQRGVPCSLQVCTEHPNTRLMGKPSQPPEPSKSPQPPKGPQPPRGLRPGGPGPVPKAASADVIYERTSEVAGPENKEQQKEFNKELEQKTGSSTEDESEQQGRKQPSASSLQVEADIIKECTIRKCKPGDKKSSKDVWCLYTKHKPERLLGRHSTYEEALAQERAIKAQGMKIAETVNTEEVISPASPKTPISPTVPKVPRTPIPVPVPREAPKKFVCPIDGREYTEAQVGEDRECPDHPDVKVIERKVVAPKPTKSPKQTAASWEAVCFVDKAFKDIQEGCQLSEVLASLHKSSYTEEDIAFIKSALLERTANDYLEGTVPEDIREQVTAVYLRESPADALVYLKQMIPEYQGDYKELLQQIVNEVGYKPELITEQVPSEATAETYKESEFLKTSDHTKEIALCFKGDRYHIYDLDFGDITPEGAKEKDIREKLKSLGVSEDKIDEALKQVRELQVTLRVKVAETEPGVYIRDIDIAVSTALTELGPQAPRASLMMRAMEKFAELNSEELARAYQSEIKERLNKELELYEGARAEIPGTHKEIGTQQGMNPIAAKQAKTPDPKKKKELVDKFKEQGVPLEQEVKKKPKPWEVSEDRQLTTVGFKLYDRVRDQANPNLTGTVIGFEGDNVVVAMDKSIYCEAGAEGLYLPDALLKIEETDAEDLNLW